MNMDDLTDRERDLLLLPEISMQLKDILYGKSLAEVVEDVYLHDTTIVFDPLVRLLPNDQIRCLNISETEHLMQLEKLVILLAALKAVKGDVRWIHWNIAKYFDMFWRAGSKCAKLPLLIHSLLAKSNFADEPYGQIYVSMIAARNLIGIAPRDAAINAIDACKGGELSAFHYAQDAAASLGIASSSVGSSNLSQLANISSSLGIAFSSHRETITAATSGLQSELIESKQIIKFPKTDGDTKHYIFHDAERSAEIPEIKIYTFINATISIDVSKIGLTTFYLFDDQGRCVADLSRGFSPFIAENVETIPGSVAILDDGYSGTMNICHFLLDKITRINIYDRGSTKPDWYLLADQYPYYTEVLNRIGVKNRIITPSEKRFSIQAEKLLISSNVLASFCHPAHMCAPWAINFLCKSFNLPVVSHPGRKIFISRNDTASRRILNESSLSSLLDKHGFETITLTGRPLSDQIQLFAEASHVIGVHGAGLTNILFSNQHCRVIEILPPFVATKAYWLLASALGQSYSGLIAEDSEFPLPNYADWVHNAQFNDRDVIIPLDRLEKMLKT
jgi:capsular polysaccharide biosynthesis protein